MSKIYVDEILPKENAQISAPNLQLPAGSVIQVVQGTTTTEVQSTSTTFVDTTLSASITPTSSSSKILVHVSHPNSDKRSGNAYMAMWLYRGATPIYRPNSQYFFTADSSTLSAGIAFSYLDSPSTTSSITYKTMFNNVAGSGTISVQRNTNPSTIILMEIAQ
jgi:hypothetical protein